MFSAFRDWLLARDVSNEMGGGCLMSAFRIVLIICSLIYLAVFIFLGYLES